MRKLMLPLVGVLLSVATVVLGQGAAPDFDAAFQSYWQADDVAAAERAARQIAASGAGFDEVLTRLKTGRVYGPQTAGVRELPTSINGTRLDNTLQVPDGYDPAKKWPLRVQLHGGVGRPAPRPGQNGGRGLTNNRIPSQGQLILQPRAWADSEWWRANQVENILKLVAQTKRLFNVDESHVYVTGISDGGTGTYYLAMRQATLWSACMPLNGHPLVLANPDVGADGQLYAGNLVNCPMQAVNGGRDQLYPASSVEPFIEMMKKGGVDLTWHVYPEAGHDTSWWPTEQASYDAFVATHPRPAYPERISWETERTDRYNRYSWLVINTLGARASDVAFDDVNTFTPGLQKQYELYDRKRPSGRVDVVRRGNLFDARSRYVREFTLLLDAVAIDFSNDIEVRVNGKRAFAGRVSRDVATLTRWAARDDDRTQLYAAELKITVP
ncbi:MAG: dienelactone hydrolase family protein [Vicinamibacterales bacterium]